MPASISWDDFRLIKAIADGHLIVWRIGNKRESKSLKEEQFGGLDDSSADEILNHCHKDRHDFLFIDVMERKFYDSNFDEIVVKPNIF